MISQDIWNVSKFLNLDHLRYLLYKNKRTKNNSYFHVFPKPGILPRYYVSSNSSLLNVQNYEKAKTSRVLVKMQRFKSCNSKISSSRIETTDKILCLLRLRSPCVTRRKEFLQWWNRQARNLFWSKHWTFKAIWYI